MTVHVLKDAHGSRSEHHAKTQCNIRTNRLRYLLIFRHVFVNFVAISVYGLSDQEDPEVDEHCTLTDLTQSPE